MILRGLHGGKAIEELRRRLSEHHGAGKLRIEAARAVVLYQYGEMLPRLEGASLLVAIGKAGAGAEGRGGAEKQPLLAAEQATLVLGERRDVGVAHAGLNVCEQPGEDFILHERRHADSNDFLGTLDGLEPVDGVRHVEEPDRR